MVDGHEADLPLGVGKRCTGATTKAMVKVYRGRVLIIWDGQLWQRVNDEDEEVVELKGKQTYRTEEPLGFRSAPRFTIG